MTSRNTKIDLATHAFQKMAKKSCAKKLWLSSLILSTAILPLSTAHSATYTQWTGAIDTDWFKAGNWSAGLPASNTETWITTPPNTVILSGAAANTSVFYASGTSNFSILNGGTLTNTNGALISSVDNMSATAVINGTGSAWNNTTDMTVGHKGQGLLTISNGGTLRDANGFISGAVNSTGNVTITGTGSQWLNTNVLYVGYGYNGPSTGYLTITDGGLASSTQGIIAFYAGSTGFATITGAGSLWQNSAPLSVGSRGTGTLLISSGGKATSTHGNIGLNTGSNGTATVTGSGSEWINSQNLYVGRGASGSLTISNGGKVQNIIGYIGLNSGVTGSATITDTNSKWINTSDLNIGNNGTGSLTIANGATVTNTFGFLGKNTGSSGTTTVTGAGSRWTNSAQLLVGYFGNGTLNILNGAIVTNTDGSISDRGGTTGRVTVDGSGSQWINSLNLYIGQNYAGVGANGSLTISNGGRVSDQSGIIGNKATSTGSVHATGPNTTWQNTTNLTIGNNGTGTLILNNKALVSSTGTITIATNTGSTGSLIIGSATASPATSAATLTTPTITFGAGTGSILFNHTEGLGTAHGGSETPYTLTSSITGNGTIKALSGITHLTGNLAAFTGTTFVQDNAALYLSNTYGGNLNINTHGTTQIDAPVSGHVTISDSTLNQFANIGGNVTLDNGGTLNANSSVNGSVFVNQGGKLKGNGTLGNLSITTGGTIAPGNSIGTLHVTGDANFTAGSTYDVEINANGENDKIIATGSSTLTGGHVNLLPETGGTYNVGTRYQILSAAGGVTGTFNSIAINTTSPFLNASLSYDTNSVYANLTRNTISFASVARTQNEREVAQALDTLPSTNALYNTIVGTTAATAPIAFRNLSGELHTDIQSNLIPSEDQFSSLYIDNRNTWNLNKKNIWVQPYGTWSENGGTNNTYQFNTTEKGLALGGEAPLTEWKNIFFGTVLGYGQSTYDLATNSNNSAKGKSDHIRLAAHATKNWDSFNIKLSSQYGYHTTETDRTVFFTGYQSRQQADYDSHTILSQGEAFYIFSPTKDVKLTPYAGLSWAYGTTAHIQESGAQGSLQTPNTSDYQGYTKTGLRAEQALPITPAATSCYKKANDQISKCALISAQIGLKHLIGDENPQGTYNFKGSTRFTTKGAPHARDTITTRFGLDLPLMDQALLNIAYTGDFTQGASTTSLSGAFIWRW